MRQRKEARATERSPNSSTLAPTMKMGRDMIPRQHLLADHNFRSPTQMPMKIRRKNHLISAKNPSQRRWITATTMMMRTSQTEDLAALPVVRESRNG